MALRAMTSVVATTATMGSPTNRTLSVAKMWRVVLERGEPSDRLKFMARAMGLTPAAFRSWPLTTAKTPGMACAAVVSKRVMLAWG